jgi:hypothetical protein
MEVKMPVPGHRSWFAWLLYRLLLLISAGLILLVIVSPWVENTVTSRVFVVFARDTTLRRTALASALGLIATAYVFFRSPGPVRRESPKASPRPPSDMAGA